MFKSIFSKLIGIFILILIISFSIAGTVLFILLDWYSSNENEKVLEQSADSINNFFNSYVEYADNPAAQAWLLQYIREMSKSTGTIIWIVHRDGYVRLSVPSVSQLVSEMGVKFSYDGSGDPLLPDSRQYTKVMLGYGTVKERGTFYGFFKNTGRKWVTIEKPLKVKDGNNKEQIMGAVYLHAPIYEVNRLRSSVFGFFMASIGIAVVVSIFFIYIFSLRISRPLKEIKDAARSIAGGEFGKRLSIVSSDEIGELANSFNQMAVDLQNLEEMRRGFIANVSHELRTPMTSIRGFIEGILDGTIPTERQHDYLTIVRDETKRLNRLVNDLMDLAKMEAGELNLSFKDFNINELIRRCIIKFENFITEKNIQVEAGFDEEETFVRADPDAIERVLINLIHNAIKFTPEGGAITLSTITQKNKVIVSVQDTGIGIDQSELNLVWGRFYKSDKSRKDKSGAGLGLAIVKNIITEHHQEIWAESEVDQGTKFIFTLDLVP